MTLIYLMIGISWLGTVLLGALFGLWCAAPQRAFENGVLEGWREAVGFANKFIDEQYTLDRMRHPVAVTVASYLERVRPKESTK